MNEPRPIEQIAERVERLLVRQHELSRTNALLTQQVQTLTSERNSLKSRLMAARSRIDELIDRLPSNQHLAYHDSTDGSANKDPS